MPGFLGTEKQFTARYSRPILASRDPKSSPKEQEAGVLHFETSLMVHHTLHRQHYGRKSCMLSRMCRRDFCSNYMLKIESGDILMVM